MEYQHFPTNFFCVTLPNIFAGEPFCAVFQKVSGSEKFTDKSGKYEDFPSDFFSLTVAKNFIGNPSLLQYFWVAEKFG